MEAISVILVGLYYCNSYIYLPPPQVSELGDKTFFIAAILAMRDNKVRRFRIHPVPVCVGLEFSCQLMLKILPAHSLPCCHRSPGSHDCPLCPAGVRGDDLHTPGVHLLRLHGHHVPLRLVQATGYSTPQTILSLI